MLVEFSVENFRSFKDRNVLRMIAAKLRASDPKLDQENVILVNAKLSLLRSALVYGANASGKSNLIKAMNFMKEFVEESAQRSDEEEIPVESFVLEMQAKEKPTIFEIVFLIEGVQYRYGFSVTEERVWKEWLYYTPTIREVELFTRDEFGVYPKPRFPEGRGIKGLEIKNKLFLSVVAQFTMGEIARKVCKWFSDNCCVITATKDDAYLPYTLQCLEKEKYKRSLTQLVNDLDIDVRGLNVVKVPYKVRGVIGDLMRKELRTIHAILDDEGAIEEEREFDAEVMESEGTRKLIALLGPLLDALTNGWTLFMDEFDSRLHPLITTSIIKLFNSPETNPMNAQLIGATHATNLLDGRLLRRDQIYFVEKDKKSVSHLYSLADFKLNASSGSKKSVRNDESYERNYLQGRYGAIPYLGDLHQFFRVDLREESDEFNPKTLEAVG